MGLTPRAMFDPPYGQIAPLVVCRVGRGLSEAHRSSRLLFPWASTRPAAFANVTSLLDSGEKGGKAVNNEYILTYGARTTNPKTRTEGRRPEQPTNRARTATRAQGEGLSFVTKAHPTEVEGMTSLMPGLSGIAEPVRSVFSHACAACTLCLLLFVLSGFW